MQNPVPGVARVTASPVVAQRQVLALEALSKLTRQFADQPDLDHLVEILLLTLTGQFSVGGSFGIFRHPGSGSARPLYFGVGRFTREHVLERLADDGGCLQSSLAGGCAYRVDDLALGPAGIPVAMLRDHGVPVIVPLQRGDRPFGLIGLGEKVTRRPFTDDEVELLGALANTVTPLLVSSFLFLEITNLKEWYRDILNSVKQGVFVFGVDLRLRKVNTAGFEILQSFAPELRDVAALENRSLPDVFPAHSYPGWARRLTSQDGRGAAALLEHLVARGPDVKRVFNVRVSSADRGDSDECDLIVTLDDVSSQKENEQRLYELQRFAERGIMTASISHELNNVLCVIQGGVELVEYAVEHGQSERAQTSLKKLLVAVGRMERFTAGLVDSSRLDSRRTVTNLNAILSDVLTFVAVQARFRHIRVEHDLDPGVPDGLMDADQISQLLLNLLNNAADAIVQAGREEGLVNVRTRLADNRIVLCVQDNGSGIPPEVQKRLFRDRLTTKEKGHGYGLVVCGRIMAEHRITWSIDSEVGRGTTFSLSFPAADDPDLTEP